jgi:hypothetical protein
MRNQWISWEAIAPVVGEIGKAVGEVERTARSEMRAEQQRMTEYVDQQMAMLRRLIEIETRKRSEAVDALSQRVKSLEARSNKPNKQPVNVVDLKRRA